MRYGVAATSSAGSETASSIPCRSEMAPRRAGTLSSTTCCVLARRCSDGPRTPPSQVARAPAASSRTRKIAKSSPMRPSVRPIQDQRALVAGGAIDGAVPPAGAAAGVSDAAVAGAAAVAPVEGGVAGGAAAAGTVGAGAGGAGGGRRAGGGRGRGRRGGGGQGRGGRGGRGRRRGGRRGRLRRGGGGGGGRRRLACGPGKLGRRPD